jgi:hypothetical protein
MLFPKPMGNTAIESFLSNTLVLFPSALIWAVDGTVCPAEYTLYGLVCCLCMQIIWHAALSSSHHAMHCCHHLVSISRSRL